jgi:hypothetical protein
MPWATVCIQSTKEFGQECRQTYEYRGQCWINRTDVIVTQKQNAEPEGRAKWHPGIRKHKLTSRILAFPILQALREAIVIWMEADNYILNDDVWHMSSYYENIRSKVMKLPRSIGFCYSSALPDGLCQYRIQGRTEFTPRVNPSETSIRSILKQSSQILSLRPVKNVYDPPDVHNPMLDVPRNAIDYINIVENGIDYQSTMRRRDEVLAMEQKLHDGNKESRNNSIPNHNLFPPGQGWSLDSVASADNCDGSYYGFCGRGTDNHCLLYGHHDYRGGLLFDGYSGWLSMTLSNMTHGIIMIKIEDWHGTGENKRTDGWTHENNNSNKEAASSSIIRTAKISPDLPHYHHHHHHDRDRSLKQGPPPFCDDFAFDFAIDNTVTTWNQQQWQEHELAIQRVVQIWTLLDDPTYTNGQVRDVELSIRQRGCGRIRTFSLTHVYWA